MVAVVNHIQEALMVVAVEVVLLVLLLLRERIGLLTTGLVVVQVWMVRQQDLYHRVHYVI